MNKQKPFRAQAARSDAPVKCAHCGRQVERRSRQQRYCSDRCRGRDHEQDRDRTRKAGLGASTGAPDGGVKNRNGNNSLQASKTGSSLPWNILGGGGWQFPEATPPDADLIAKIRHCEIGGELVSVAEATHGQG